MLNAVLVAKGLHHAETVGQITVGPGPGEVPAIGVAQLLKLPLPFSKGVYKPVGFEDQSYVICQSLDGNVSNIAFDAVQFEYDPVTGQPIARLLVDIAAAPASVELWFEAHHSTGR
jgi:hypothetical protein